MPAYKKIESLKNGGSWGKFRWKTCGFEWVNMWVTAFADVAKLIMGVSVEEFNAFDDEGRKRIAWGCKERNVTGPLEKL